MTDDQRHAHEWTRVEGGEGIRAWACTECDETSATCGTCNRASGSSLLLCGPCERHAARVLDDIAAALEHYAPNPRSPIASPGDMHLVPGGVRRDPVQPDEIVGEMWSWLARWSEHVPGGVGAAS